MVRHMHHFARVFGQIHGEFRRARGRGRRWGEITFFKGKRIGLLFLFRQGSGAVFARVIQAQVRIDRAMPQIEQRIFWTFARN